MQLVSSLSFCNDTWAVLNTAMYNWKSKKYLFALVKHFGTPKSRQVKEKILEESNSESIDDSSSQPSTPNKKKTSRDCYIIPSENLVLLKQLFNFKISDEELHTCLGWVCASTLINNAFEKYTNLPLKSPFEDYENAERKNSPITILFKKNVKNCY